MLANHRFFSGAKILFSLIIALSLVTMLFASPDSAANPLVERIQGTLSNYFTAPIQVSADNMGVVTLQGNVNTVYDKYKIFDIVSTIPGVREIRDYMTASAVNPEGINLSPVPDSTIQTNVLYELKLDHAILAPERIHVHVDNGMVTLSGTVSSYNELVSAETATSWQNGVRSIQDDITVLPPKKAVSDKNLKTVVTDILKNQFRLDQEVSVAVNDGVVTLSGKVPNLWSKYQIEKDAHEVMGVKNVVNNIEVATPKLLSVKSLY